MPFSLTSSCDLHIPHPAPDPADPNYVAKIRENNLALERWASYFSRNCSGRLQVPFSHAGEFLVADPVVLSPPWGSHTSRTLTGFTAVGESAGNTGTVTVYIDGNDELEITWDGARIFEVPFSWSFIADDTYMQMAITDVESGDIFAGPGQFTIIAHFT